MGRIATLTALSSFAGLLSVACPALAQVAPDEEEVLADSLEESPPSEDDEEMSEVSPEEGEPVTESDERARQLYLEGDRHYAEGRYEEAVAAFRESYALSGRPLLLFNLANAYERIGSHEEAADALTRYLDHAEEAERVTLQRRIDALRARAAERHEPEPDPSPSAPVEPPDDTPA